MSHVGWESERNLIPSHVLPAATVRGLFRTAADQAQSGLNGDPSKAMSYFAKSAAMTSRSG
jgi:hypothetical protein